MSPALSPRHSRLLGLTSIALMVAVFAAQIVSDGTVVPSWLLGSAVAAAAIAGPVAWISRDRIDDDRRETLAVIGLVGGLVAMPLVVGVAIVLQADVLAASGNLVVGTGIGFGVAFALERFVVPEQYRYRYEST